MSENSKQSEIMTSAVVTLSLIELLMKKGVTSEKITEKSGITKSSMQDPDICIPYKQLIELFRFAIDVTGDPALALHLRKEYGIGTMHFVSCIALNSENLLKAAKHLCKYGKLFSIADQMELREENEIVTFTFTLTSPAHQNIWIPEHHLSLAILYCRQFSGKNIKPLEVRFQHPAPAYAAEYKKVFQSPVIFDQEENAIDFDRKDMLAKITLRNPHLQAVLIKQAEASLQKLRKENTYGRKVQEYILTNLPKGDINIEMASAKLHITRATLHRKLKQEGISFTSLLESTRKELARKYLKEGMNATQVTYLLGFAHPSAMQKAFKRWYNKSPGQLRKELAAS